MTPLNRIRKLSGLPLNESVADDEAINLIIERELAALPAVEQSKYIDALEVLKNAGTMGLDGRAWVAAYRNLRDDADAPKTVAACAHMFFELVVRKTGSKYVWSESIGDAPEDYQDDPIHDPAIQAAVSGQVNLTYELLAYCRQMETVNIRSLSRIVSNRVPSMDATMAQQVALNFLDAHRGMFKSIGNDEFEVHDLDARQPKGSTNYSQMFRDIANGASNQPKDL